MPNDSGARRTLIVLGTRPEAIKLAPLARMLRESAEFAVEVCVTSQHQDLVAPVLDFFGVAIDHDLKIGVAGQSPAAVTARVLRGVGELLATSGFDHVVVQGDTSSALGGALAAFYAGVRLAHVEAGLRSSDLHAPFPEEGHRRAIDVLADDLFAPTIQARENLRREGVAAERVTVSGNTGIDALLFAWEELCRRPRPLPIEVEIDAPLVLLTTHRRESFGAPLERILAAVRTIAEKRPDARVLFPVHPNPSVRRAAETRLAGAAGVCLVEPLSCPDLIQALLRADLVLTDSGGVQEEAGALGKRILVLRDDTERPEGVREGLAELVGTDPDRIVARALAIIDGRAALSRLASDSAPLLPLYGDGRACERIRAVLLGRTEARSS